VQTKSLEELDYQKLCRTKSSEFLGILKMEAPELSKSLKLLKQIYSSQSFKEAISILDENVILGQKTDSQPESFFKLQVTLLSAWNSMTQNRLYLAGLFNRLGSSIIFPMDLKFLVKSLQDSTLVNVSLKDKILMKIHSVENEKIARHMFEQLQMVCLDENKECNDEKELGNYIISIQMRSLFKKLIIFSEWPYLTWAIVGSCQGRKVRLF